MINGPLRKGSRVTRCIPLILIDTDDNENVRIEALNVR
jgi:hypothetical protein